RAPALGELAERTAEQSAPERAPRDHADPVRTARREHLELDGARREVVQALLRDQAQEVARRGGGVRLRDVPAGEVAAADVQDLPPRHEQLERLPVLVPRRVPVDVMHLVEIDVVGLEAAQALVAGPPDVQGRQAIVVRSLAHAAVDLGRQDDALATSTALRQPAADDLLGDALARLPAVDVGRVEEVDAELEGPVHDGAAVGFAGEWTEVHRAQAETAHLHTGTPEPDVLHAFLYHECPGGRPSSVRTTSRAAVLARAPAIGLYSAPRCDGPGRGGAGPTRPAPGGP